MERVTEWTFEGSLERVFQVGTDGFRDRYTRGVYDGIRKVDLMGQFEWHRGFYSSQAYIPMLGTFFVS